MKKPSPSAAGSTGDTRALRTRALARIHSSTSGRSSEGTALEGTASDDGPVAMQTEAALVQPLGCSVSYGQRTHVAVGVVVPFVNADRPPMHLGLVLLVCEWSVNSAGAVCA